MPRETKQTDEIVEVDPTGRYGRYSAMLGKGAYKIVYKAFDELEGMEVAWNQVKVSDVLRKAEDLDRLYSEVHLLQTLKHNNIIKCYSSWVDTEQDNINFITEVFTSGNLREYRNKHKHVNLRALKNWSRQILQGLIYLHSHDPPVIHRDLKCDNIFVNGNQGVVKIGDLGLAAILYQAHAAHSVIGTPEFMAPELYEEEYDELVDIYAFGMCLLELVTFEYPYSECSNAAQIFKKVSSGIKPAALAKVNDPEVKKFIEKCIAVVSERLSARELLDDPFLLPTEDMENSGGSLLSRSTQEDGPSNIRDLSSSQDLTVEGQRKDVNTIFLKLRIANPSGHADDIHFPFDIKKDTSINVASEMLAALDLTDQDVTTIASMIDSEIQCHVPNWKPGEITDKKDDDTAVNQNLHSANGDETSELPIKQEKVSSGLVLDRFSPGHSSHSNSPQESNEGSPCRSVVSSGKTESGSVKGNVSSVVHGEKGDDNVGGDDGRMHNVDSHIVLPESEQEPSKIIICKLEDLLIKQKKEVAEQQKRHQEAVEEILVKLPQELRNETLRKCRMKIMVHGGTEAKERA